MFIRTVTVAELKTTAVAVLQGCKKDAGEREKDSYLAESWHAT